MNDALIRHAVFDWLAAQVDLHGDVLPRAVLQQGLNYQGKRVPLVGPKGIFKPALVGDAPLSITTSPNSPYDDAFGKDQLLRYRYRGTDPEHPDNVGLRHAMLQRIPLVYFHGVMPGKYVAVWPVYIVGDNPGQLTFTVAMDDALSVDMWERRLAGELVPDPASEVRRGYITSALRVRLHQRAFRERVLAAYHSQCALCRLRHEELLDAAHIIPDSEPEGEPIVPNGLSLCKLHHAAFDRLFIGIRPDYLVEVRHDLLEESDGPMLQHGLKELHHRKIILPGSLAMRPDPERLSQRYELFRILAT
jgi:putative restriction endonuclease